MRVIIGGQYQPYLDGSSVSIRRSASDPVPTCALHLSDVNSSLTIPAMSEILILDDQQIPNPTVNLLQNPSANPYTTSWHIDSPVTGITPSQTGGGGVTFTFSNAANSAEQDIYQYLVVGSIVPGQVYSVSFSAQATSPVNLQLNGLVACIDQSQNVTGRTFFPAVTPPTSLTRYSISFTAPANTSFAEIDIYIVTTSATNSGSVSLTKFQFEPQWLPNITYPTPWCGPSQTNCVQLPLGYWIRQYRKFAGFVNHVTYSDYHGNVRTVQVDAVGYAWLMSTILCNDAFTSKTDAQIITTLLGKYLITSGMIVINDGTALLSTTNVIAGATFSSVQSNWDDLRTILDNLASQTGYYWTVDFYWAFSYAPPGYFSMPIELICDNSEAPDMVTTFPAYNFSAEMDYTQPGSTILVLGGTGFSAEVIDPSSLAANSIASGYFLPTGNSYMRKVNETSLLSTADCTNRGMAELLSYDYPRNLYHLTANVELIAGQSIQVTSATDNLNSTSLLLQQVTATWIGTNETLTDEWEYAADLGATNRAATNIISRLFRLSTRNTSAPAIGATTLAVFERVGLVDTANTPSTPGAATYASTVLGDGVTAWYRLGETTGTIADDYSGNGYIGTINGTVTKDVAGPLSTDPTTAITFDGSSGYVSCPAGLSTSGATAFSVEFWINLTTGTLTGNPRVVDNSKSDVDHHGFEVLINNAAKTVALTIGDGSTSATVTTSSALVVGTYAYIAATFDGSNMRIYFNGSLQHTTAFSASINASSNVVNIGRNVTGADNWMPATLANVGLYIGTVLSGAQISNHYSFH